MRAFRSQVRRSTNILPTSRVFKRHYVAQETPLTPPPMHEEPHHPWEWAYPLAIMAVGAAVATGIYYYGQEEEEKTISKKEEATIMPDTPPVSPELSVNSFPYVCEDTRDLSAAFRYAGSFAIAMGPPDFNHRDLVKHYLSDKRHAMVLGIHPQRHSKLFKPGNTSSAIWEMLERCLIQSPEYQALPKTSSFSKVVVPHKENDIFMRMGEFIHQRGPSSEQFIWFEQFDLLLDYIEQIVDPVVKEKEEAMMRGLLSWLVEMSLEREWTQVLLQSHDPNFISRLEKYLPVRSTPRIRMVTLGEPSQKLMERRLTKLLEKNEICMKPQDVTFVVDKLGGSYLILDEVVKLLVSGHSTNTIIRKGVQPLVVGIEKLLLESPYRVALWELLERLVANFEETGDLYIPAKYVLYSPEAQNKFDSSVWNELREYLFYYENPTRHILHQESQTSNQPKSYISTASRRAMTACSILVHDPDLKRYMWNEKKKISHADNIKFFDYSK